MRKNRFPNSHPPVSFSDTTPLLIHQFQTGDSDDNSSHVAMGRRFAQ